LHAARVQQAVVGVLVVAHQQATAAAFERVELQAVVVHAHLQRLLGGAVRRIGSPGRHGPRDAHRFAPGRQHLGRVALGHDHGVGLGSRNALEAQPRRGGGLQAAGTAGQGREDRRGCQPDAALQHDAACRAGDLVDAGVRRAVAVLQAGAVLHGADVLGHGVAV
jgi:hypothetical protein